MVWVNSNDFIIIPRAQGAFLVFHLFDIILEEDDEKSFTLECTGRAA